jgi:hypothetical protein
MCSVNVIFANSYLFSKVKLKDTTGIMLRQQFTPSPFTLENICAAVTHENLTIITDCLKHNTVAVNLFQ